MKKFFDQFNKLSYRQQVHFIWIVALIAMAPGIVLISAIALRNAL